jgi:uncharacterized protein YrrD
MIYLEGVIYIMSQLHKLGNFTGYHLHARDGEIGSLKEIYFDDQHWIVRYFVVHTGNWLLGQDVLIVPQAIIDIDEKNKQLVVDLSCEQIKNCPPVDTTLPVSRYYEQEYYHYYGLEPYWVGDPLVTPAYYMPPPTTEEKPTRPEHPHLRSSNEVLGYHIHGKDGEIGHVDDFILEAPDWVISYLQINTSNWFTGKQVLIPSAWIQQVSWDKEEVRVNLTCESIKTAPPYDAAKVIEPDYLLTLFKYYQMKFAQE